MKSDPDEYSIEDLEKSVSQTDYWDGVRNYQARNFMRDDIRVGDHVLFYHSGKKPSVVGTARVVRSGYPDHTAWDPASRHYDAKSKAEEPIWFMVDIKLENVFKKPLSLSELRRIPGLKEMMLLKKGSRLSVQPVTPKEFDIIVALSKTASHQE
jgi:predicted RNA-binding protein with PUA-like domain